MKSRHKRRNLKKNIKLPLKNPSKPAWLKGGLIGLIYGILSSLFYIYDNPLYFSFSEIISKTALFVILICGLIGTILGSLYPKIQKIKNKSVRNIIITVFFLIIILIIFFTYAVIYFFKPA